MLSHKTRNDSVRERKELFSIEEGDSELPLCLVQMVDDESVEGLRANALLPTNFELLRKFIEGCSQHTRLILSLGSKIFLFFHFGVQLGGFGFSRDDFYLLNSFGFSKFLGNGLVDLNDGLSTNRYKRYLHNRHLPILTEGHCLH